MVLKLVKDTLAWVESKQGTKKAETAATALSVTGSIVQVGDKYRVFESFKDNVAWVASGLCRQNGPVSQLSPYLTRKPGIQS